MSLSRAKALAIIAPKPAYPYEARAQRITGSGVMVFHVDSSTGEVTDVTVQKSTGSPVLDNAAVTGFRRWKFRPGTAPKVTAPITFTLTGASY
jgi:TonB family protein